MKGLKKIIAEAKNSVVEMHYLMDGYYKGDSWFARL